MVLRETHKEIKVSVSSSSLVLVGRNDRDIGPKNPHGISETLRLTPTKIDNFPTFPTLIRIPKNNILHIYFYINLNKNCHFDS